MYSVDMLARCCRCRWLVWHGSLVVADVDVDVGGMAGLFLLMWLACCPRWMTHATKRHLVKNKKA